ncbi:glycosyltransferase family 31 protein [Calycina marina]|uniref:Glycosyltransferase family 31 protein n=1 Tax=Calycina marina TaxID=1763456 RepID=A0A9P7Z3W3_9HELO|nr:glycosyltransferase family 31 protein [Calycina marina]
MLPRTPVHRWLAVAFVFALVLYIHPDLRGSTIITKSLAPSRAGSGIDDLSWVKEVLCNHSIGPELSYASRIIKYIPDQVERKSITEIDHDLLPQKFKDVSMKRLSALPAATPVEVHIKKSMRPDDVDASAFIFGASTTYKRFIEPATHPVEEWKRWLTDGQGHSNGAGLVLQLFGASDEEVVHTSEILLKTGVNASVVHANNKLDMAGRYVALVDRIYNHPTRDSRKFFVLIDDDTFFPALSELQRVLTDYNPARPYYIGTFTERAEWFLRDHAAFGFGGGGIFLTAPMAKTISEAPCLQGKRENNVWRYNLNADQGDRLLFNCIANFTDIKLTYLPRLHQIDQFGDLSGFYENGGQPLSLHHYKSWHRFDVADMHKVADACGEDCVLQRFQFKDNFIISNGYSVCEYPKGITFDPLQSEDTFDNPAVTHDVDLAYSMGAQRSKLAFTGKKRQWLLLASRSEGAGVVRQVYLRRWSDPRWYGPGEEPTGDDSILVLLWSP